MLQLLATFVIFETVIDPWLAIEDDGVAVGAELLLLVLFEASGLLLGEVEALDCETSPVTRTCWPTWADSFEESPVRVYCVPELSVRMKPDPAEPWLKHPSIACPVRLDELLELELCADGLDASVGVDCVCVEGVAVEFVSAGVSGGSCDCGRSGSGAFC